MKRLFIVVVSMLVMALVSVAQNTKNNVPDSIIGRYESVQAGDAYKVSVTRNTDGSYKAQIYWIKNDIDTKTGQKKLDTKNPDKSLRNTPSDKVVLFNGLKYDAEKKVWNGTKIYDPQRGIRANVTAKFESNGKLSLKGTVLGISETAHWTPLAE